MLHFGVIGSNIDFFFAELQAPLDDFTLPAAGFPQGLWHALDQTIGRNVTDSVTGGGTRPHCAFAPLSPAYAKRKARAGHGDGLILVRKGKLIQSFTPGAQGHLFTQSAKSMLTGSLVEYALYHQTGFRTRLGQSHSRSVHQSVSRRGTERPTDRKTERLAEVLARRPLEPGDMERANWSALMARYVAQRYRARGVAIVDSHGSAGKAKAAGVAYFASPVPDGRGASLPLASGI